MNTFLMILFLLFVVGAFVDAFKNPKKNKELTEEFQKKRKADYERQKQQYKLQQDKKQQVTR